MRCVDSFFWVALRFDLSDLFEVPIELCCKVEGKWNISAKGYMSLVTDQECVVTSLESYFNTLLQNRHEFCYFPGDKPCFIPIKTMLSVWIVEGLKMIYGELRELQEVNRADLRLYKVTLFFHSQTAS